MSDSIFLEFSNNGTTWEKVQHFISYSVDADLYVADHAFSVELANPEIEIARGAQCRLHVNDQLALTGIVDRRFRRADKQGRRQVVEGRDLMGLIVDSCCEHFVSAEGKTLKQLAMMLLKDVPFINRASIVYQNDQVAKIKSRSSRNASYGLAAIWDTGERVRQIHPGMTKFQVLQMACLSVGQMFYSLPDGTFVFGRPMTGGVPDFSIIFNPEGMGNNVLSGEVEENIAKCFSKVTVVGQQQANPADLNDTGAHNLPGVPVYDKTFPFYKPFVQVSYNDSQTPQQHARLIMEKARHDGFRLTYEVPRHSPDGVNNYTINRIAHVQDDVHGIHGDYLVSGRTFKLDKGTGPTTTLKLSPPGLVESGTLTRGAK